MSTKKSKKVEAETKTETSKEVVAVMDNLRNVATEITRAVMSVDRISDVPDTIVQKIFSLQRSILKSTNHIKKQLMGLGAKAERLEAKEERAAVASEKKVEKLEKLVEQQRKLAERISKMQEVK